MPICGKCGRPAEYSNSAEHPAPYQNQWLCQQCYLLIDLQSREPTPLLKFKEVKP